MSIQVIPLKVIIRSHHGKSSKGEVQLQIWDRKARLRRAMKFWGMMWGFALVAVFIPGLHFILVPSFLIAGPIGAAWISNQERAISGGQGTCPECGAALPIARNADRWPLSDLCSGCQQALMIEREEEVTP